MESATVVERHQVAICKSHRIAKVGVAHQQSKNSVGAVKRSHGIVRQAVRRNEAIVVVDRLDLSLSVQLDEGSVCRQFLIVGM